MKRPCKELCTQEDDYKQAFPVRPTGGHPTFKNQNING